MKLRTLFDCRNHWQWLWITGSWSKRSYEPSAKWSASCACCNNTDICENCPLVGYAWSRHCLSSKNSIFRKWQKAETKKTRIKYAHKMVQACNRAIEEELTK